MVFLPPKSAGELPPIPDNITICEFMLNEKYGRRPMTVSRDPFTCGITKKSYSTQEVVERVDLLARAIAKELNWEPNRGSEWDKAMGIFALNTVSVGCTWEEIVKCIFRADHRPLALRSTRYRCHGQFIAWEAS